MRRDVRREARRPAHRHRRARHWSTRGFRAGKRRRQDLPRVVRVPERAHDGDVRVHEHARDGGVPRSGAYRGRVRAGAGDGRPGARSSGWIRWRCGFAITRTSTRRKSRPYSSGTLARCLEEGAKRFGWAGRSSRSNDGGRVDKIAHNPGNAQTTSKRGGPSPPAPAPAATRIRTRGADLAGRRWAASLRHRAHPPRRIHRRAHRHAGPRHRRPHHPRPGRRRSVRRATRPTFASSSAIRSARPTPRTRGAR